MDELHFLRPHVVGSFVLAPFGCFVLAPLACFLAPLACFLAPLACLLAPFVSFLAHLVCFLAPLLCFLLSAGEVERRARLFTVKVEVVDILFVKFTALPFLFFFTATATHRRISKSYNVFEFAFLVVVHFHDGRLIAYFEKGFLSHHFI